MNESKKLQKEAMNVLKQTSRTFYIPITLLEPTLKKTVAAAYLCMRAIDEIEDHEQLDTDTKHDLLQAISDMLNEDFDNEAYKQLLQPYVTLLPEVTLRLGDWLTFCPDGVTDKVKASTSIMAKGMGEWASKGWLIKTKEDLDDYTYYVAGLVGVMLSDIWKWYDGTETDQDLAIGFGRGLQSVNILRNQKEDDDRGVTFFPEDWNRDDMFAYATANLSLADEYLKDINTRTIKTFCKIPLALAKRTINALKDGKEKISRDEVGEIVEQVQNT